MKKKLSLFVTAQKKIARRGAHCACRVSVLPASILVPRADHPQHQCPLSPRPVPPTTLSTHQAPSPLPVPFFFLLTLPLTPPKFDSLHRQKPHELLHRTPTRPAESLIGTVSLATQNLPTNSNSAPHRRTSSSGHRFAHPTAQIGCK